MAKKLKNMTDLKTLGERLEYARERSGLSQTKLAVKLGISQQAVQKVEKGETKKPKWLFEAGRILKVNYDWLLTGEGPFSAVEYEQKLSIEAKGLSEQGAKALDDFYNYLLDRENKK